MKLSLVTLLLAMLVSCGTASNNKATNNTDPNGDPNNAINAHTSSSTAGTTNANANNDTTPVDRGPRLIQIDGDANGLWWDAGSSTLFVAEDNGNRILRWTDSAGFALVADLPMNTSDAPGLGQLVLLQDGSIVVTRFGHGISGDVVHIPASGQPTIIAGLDPERRRVGLTVTDDGRLFSAWFTRAASGPRVGAIGELSLNGTEPEVITGLQKPVGVLAIGTDLFVSDQDLGQILKAPLSDLSNYTVLATIAQPDLLAAGPDGSIFAGSAGGNVYKISTSGAATLFESGFQQVRGVAYDATNRRLFVAEHDPDESDGINHVLHVFPVD